MKRSQAVLSSVLALLLLLLATNILLAQPATREVTPDVNAQATGDVTPTNVIVFTDGRINPQPFAPVVLYCSSPAGGRFNGAQRVSGFPVIQTGSTPTATPQTPNENTALTVYILNSAGQGTLAWEFDFATGRLLVPSSQDGGASTSQSQNNPPATPTGTRELGSDAQGSVTSTPVGSGTTATPTQSAALPVNSFSRQSIVIAQANTPTPTGPSQVTSTATATQIGIATSTLNASGSSETPVATVSGSTTSGQSVNRSVTLASGAGVSLSISNGRYIISAPQLDGKLYQFVFDGCPTVGDFDVLVNGVSTE